MPERQLRLFDHPKPLLTRLGADFFKSLPKSPGVYLMFNDTDRLLYVGQSSNLRSRLGTYKNANPNHVPRKVLRLVHSVARIAIEPCETPLAARLRENELLRTRRPRFNRMNTWPKAYWFVGCREEGDVLRLWITLQAEETDHLYGAFKANTRAAFGALLRLLGHPVSLFRPPRSFELPARNGLREFFGGTSDRLLAEATPLDESTFAQTLFLHDQELVMRFFESGPSRNRRICEKYGLTRIPQERLDDLIALG
ncbi:MAG TPA: nucleotide excision repair endonuclease [Candidatus Binatia bacterium]|nr:nucleotide excision repair endonuclease [Candidatus Binatia bacterium]